MRREVTNRNYVREYVSDISVNDLCFDQTGLLAGL